MILTKSPFFRVVAPGQHLGRLLHRFFQIFRFYPVIPHFPALRSRFVRA